MKTVHKYVLRTSLRFQLYVSDEHSGSYGGRGKFVKQYKITIRDNKGPVALAKSAKVMGAIDAEKAKITGTPRNHATGITMM